MLKNIIMLQKVRFRLVFNRACRLNRNGEGLVQIECSQGSRRIYISTHVYVKPLFWNPVQMIHGHPLSQGLNAALLQMLIEVEQIELDYIRRGVHPTLMMIRDALREHMSPSARLRDFIREVVSNSDRKEHTKQGYQTLLNNLERFRKGSLVADVDYQFIIKYDSWLKKENLMHNTRVGRLRMLRAIMNEAVARELIARNPFERFQIPPMTPKQGYIPAEKLKKLKKLKVSGRKELVRDAFLFCCFTGLRFCDIVTLRSTHISNDGWIKKQMVKTGFTVEIPMGKIFNGEAIDIIKKYGTIEKISTRLGQNGTVNSILRELFSRIGLADCHYTFHTARHTFAQLLLHQGMPMTAVQQMLGHQKMETTQIYGQRDRKTLLAEMRKVKYDNKPKTQKQ